MTTPDHTAQTWRDVADRLTAAQIAQLERLERDEAGTLPEMAREWAAKNMNSGEPFDDVAPPTGAVRTFAWSATSRAPRAAAGRPAFRSSADSRPTARRDGGAPCIPATWTHWTRRRPANWR